MNRKAQDLMLGAPGEAADKQNSAFSPSLPGILPPDSVFYGTLIGTRPVEWEGLPWAEQS
jgi:hypothetical protein